MHMLRLIALVSLPVSLAGCVHAAPPAQAPQPDIAARTKPVLELGGLRFKDLNANGKLEPYEDWRLESAERAADLVTRMTLAEKAGMMLIATNNPDCGGGISERGRDLIDNQKMTRFILGSGSDLRCVKLPPNVRDEHDGLPFDSRRLGWLV